MCRIFISCLLINRELFTVNISTRIRKTLELHQFWLDYYGTAFASFIYG